MSDLCRLIWCALIGLFRSRASLEAEILVLRHQLNVLRRKSPKRLAFRSTDRLVFAGLYRLAPGGLDALKILKPETVIRWPRAGFRAYWRWKSRARGGRPKTLLEVRQLIRDMSIENPLWGAPRIHGELLKLGIDVGQTTVAKLEVRPASFRRLRGPTYVAVIADELAFWYVDAAYANPDVEILNAVEPGLATTGGPLILASSPHARRGVLWEMFKRHHGAGGDPLILVAHGASRTLNPTLPQRVGDRALEQDRSRATAEYLAEFRTDVEGFGALEVVESCVGDHREMMPASGSFYRAFVDPSGGSADSFTLAVAHKDRDKHKRIVIDAVRERRPPFSPEDVVEEFAALLQTYRVSSVTGDRYA